MSANAGAAISLHDFERASVVAPAGCGKTQLVADALASHTGAKPILVLTHTNAGVAALRARLARAHVPAGRARVCTIDGWAMRMASMFPGRSGLPPDVTRLLNPGRDYPAIRAAALALLAAGHVRELLRASYARAVVDEYQDCDPVQHALVSFVADAVPTVVLGDPMQAIFDFRGPLADWDGEVTRQFPVGAELTTPWRWLGAGAGELGEWLMDARAALSAGADVDLSRAPASVRWVELAGTGDDFRLQCRAAGERVPGGGRVLIVADSTNRDLQQQFARHVPGAVTVERVDLPDLTEFADRLDLDADPAYVDLLPSVARFTATLFTGFSDRELLERVRVLGRGTARTPATPVEGAARRFGADPTPHRLLAFLDAVAGAPGVRSHRPQVVAACRKALRLCGQHPDVTFGAAARRVREEHRAGLGALPARAVGSTLLLKGLEADGVVIPDASRMSARHLYVAMTRGSRRLVVCSPTHLLRPMGSRAAARGAA